ncbi:MAG: transcriptional regulator [Candidatus Nomurabacteria bacterium]|jgi:DNA-binding transcriptional ArsR family regulator|nr:transcriptional regulator [Candidatus Nomurabacteria bacterium]
MIDALFGSKTRVKLLYLLFNNPERSFYVREITRKIDEQINSVRRELSNMLEIGIAKSENKNNRLYYRANEEHPFYEPLRHIFTSTALLSDETEPDVDERAKRFKTLGDVRAVLLAGKLVPGSISDVDILVVGDVSKVKLKNLVKAMEKENDISISYSTLAYEDFYYRLSVRDKFLDDILGTQHTVLIDTEKILSRET